MKRELLNKKLLKYFLRFPVKNRIEYSVEDKAYRFREDTDYRYIALFSDGKYIFNRHMFSTLHIFPNEDIYDQKDNEYVFNLFLLNRIFIYYNKSL